MDTYYPNLRVHVQHMDPYYPKSPCPTHGQVDIYTILRAHVQHMDMWTHTILRVHHNQIKQLKDLVGKMK